MKIRNYLMIAFALLVFAGNLYAANGDLSVNGTFNVGAGGVKFPDGSTQTTAVSPTIQNKVTTSRSFGTVFQNMTGKPIFCSVIVSLAVLNYDVSAYTDTAADPITLVSKVHLWYANASPTTLNFWVLPGNYYKVERENANISLVQWIEWY